MMKTVVIATLIAGATMSTAFAADLPSRKAPVYAPPPPVFTWSGFYVGANAGATVTESNSLQTAAATTFITAAAPSAATLSAIAITEGLATNNYGFGRRTGAILGVQAGYNYAFYNSFLIGFEADIQGVISSSQRAFSFGSGVNTGGVTYSASSNVTRRLDYLGTARARLGYTFTPAFLLYATGGLAYGQVKSQVAFFGTDNVPQQPFGVTAGVNRTKVGYAVGGGGEYMFMQNWSLKAEYLYYDLGTVNYPVGQFVRNTAAGAPINGSAILARTKVNGHIARLGVNYHFWGPPAAAVVARY